MNFREGILGRIPIGKGGPVGRLLGLRIRNNFLRTHDSNRNGNSWQRPLAAQISNTLLAFNRIYTLRTLRTLRDLMRELTRAFLGRFLDNLRRRQFPPFFDHQRRLYSRCAGNEQSSEQYFWLLRVATK
jgi:hypothetical protein